MQGLRTLVAALSLSYVSFNVVASNNLSVESPLVDKNAFQNSNVEKSHYHIAGYKYVDLLEQEQHGYGPLMDYRSNLEVLVTDIALYGYSEKLLAEFQRLENNKLHKIANSIGLSVLELPQFWDYFLTNSDKYIRNSDLTQKDYSISAVERIKVRCNGTYCNNPNNLVLRGLIVWAFIGRVGATESADVRIINDSNVEYAQSSGIWRHNGSGSIEYIGKKCEQCSLN